ncbi:MAG: hypothetical protein KGL53_13050 [Elusimicrobia bacterium]|nr:hypothetical protein [Elusimicrobiota bacterium]
MSRRRRAWFILAAIALAVAGALSGAPPRWRAHRDWERGLADARAGDVQGARDSFSLCLLDRPGDEDCAAAYDLARRAYEAQDPERLERERMSVLEELTAGIVRTAKAPAAGSPGDDDKKRAVQHWNEGIKDFASSQPAKARAEWLLCRRFDPSNSDCADGLKRLDSMDGARP